MSPRRSLLPILMAIAGLCSCSALLGDFTLGSDDGGLGDGATPAEASPAGDSQVVDGGVDRSATSDVTSGPDAQDGSARDATVADAPDSDTSAGDSGGGETSPIDAPAESTGSACTAADDTCSDPGTLRQCDAAGAGFDLVPCSIACSSAGGAHCTSLYPSAPVTTADLSVAGVTATTFPAGVTIADTDTGALTGALVRAANAVTTRTEVVAGIAFHQANGVGVWSVSSLTVVAGATVDVIGGNAAVFVSQSTLSVDGLIDVRPMDGSGTLCSHTGLPAGPGGAASGTTTSGPGGDYGAMGAGPGGGGGASENPGSPPAVAGGGGGAGHFAIGGAGSGTLVGTTCGGSPGGGGVAYGIGSDAGVTGGSGGGAGTSTSGGGGGGAVRLVAGQAITIGDGTAAEGINAGGCGGLGSTTGPGGGGSGGTIFLEAPFVQLEPMGTLAANGGGGGGALSSTATDGMPGALSASAAYGAGSNPISQAAGNGGAGNAPAGNAASTCNSGGGGSAGWIFINSSGTGPTTQSSGAVLSPSTASGACVFGTADVH